jgi:hypothetical protein
VKRALALWTIAAGCAAPAAPHRATAPPADVAWSCDVAVADDLSRLAVTMSFRGAPPARLVLGDARGLAAIARLHAAPPTSSESFGRDADGFALSGVPDDATVTYSVDLGRLADDGAATRVGECICADPGAWLLRPDPLPAGAAAALVLHLPDGAQATVPWPRRADGAFLLGPTAFRWRAFAAFGRLETHAVEAAGATLDVAVLDRPHAATWPGIESWIVAAARAQSSLWGAFPVPRAQIVVKPVSSDQAVAFGETLRGGGPAVVLRLAGDAADDALADDWVAVHEFTHLGMPAMPDADAWLSEGLVTYWQCVLRARAGLVDERAAWQELVTGLARGRAAHGKAALAAESAAMDGAHSHPAVYWAGAAVGLLLDVELRRSSGGARSLDDAMREIRRAFAGRASSVPAAEILAHLDAWHGRPLFRDVTRRLLASSEFPATAETLARLGVVVAPDGRVTALDDAAPDAGVRRAIMARAGD